MQNKTKIVQNNYWQLVFRIIKWTVPLFTALVLYRKFYKDESIEPLSAPLRYVEWYWYVLLSLFSILNWGLETWKWKYLVKTLEPMSFRTAAKSVLSGVAVSQLLPYRTGEYLGRLAYVTDRHKIAAGVLSVAGSFSQFLVTMLSGIIAFVIVRPVHYPWYLTASIALLLALLVVGYFYIPQFKHLRKNTFFETVRSAFEPLTQKDFAVVFVLSLLRYVSFVIPYALIAQYFDLPATGGLVYGIACVACIYFLQTVSPNFILTDLVIRVTVPAMVFSHAGLTTGNEYIPGMFIYIFNIAIPMCIGAVILLSAKLRK